MSKVPKFRVMPTYAPFKELLSGMVPLSWGQPSLGPNCVEIDCPHYAIETDYGDYGSIEAQYPVCVGFVSERACYSGEERFLENGEDARKCRLYQISQGQRYPKKEE